MILIKYNPWFFCMLYRFILFFSGNVNTLSSLNAMEGEFHMHGELHHSQNIESRKPNQIQKQKKWGGNYVESTHCRRNSISKCLAYDPKMFPLFQKGECIVLHDIIKNTDG